MYVLILFSFLVAHGDGYETSYSPNSSAAIATAGYVSRAACERALAQVSEASNGQVSGVCTAQKLPKAKKPK